jgi:hypothetical protein
MPTSVPFHDIVGPHPGHPHPLGIHLLAADGHSKHGVPHRALNINPAGSAGFEQAMRQNVIKHHVGPKEMARDLARRAAYARQGLVDPTRRFPVNSNTQKGNWAEILLAEYLAISCGANVPVYRLRCNPNVDQSMKGDDVLAFDLDSDPVRVLVGEAKFRSTSSKQVVDEIISALSKSQRAGIPVSLQFVADRLFNDNNAALGARVENCNLLFITGKLRLDHVGLLVSDGKAATQINNSAKSTLHRLAVISLGFATPSNVIQTCFKDIEVQP